MIAVTYVDHMGDDDRVADAARVSFAKTAGNFSRARGMMGLDCPKCQGPTTVTDSRPKRDGIRRRRRCDVCKERFTTAEVHVESIDEALADPAALTPGVMHQVHELFRAIPKLNADDRGLLMSLARHLVAKNASTGAQL